MKTISFALFACLVCFVHSSFAEIPKPNIIFIFADDLGWGDLSCYGNHRIKTPALDKLASEGTLFTHFYVAGSVCSPSRVGIMTGQYPARHKVFGHFANERSNQRRGMPNALNPDVTLLTDLLKEAGYTTGHFGKWHLGDVSPEEYRLDFFRTNKHSNVKGGKILNYFSAYTRPTSTRRILDETMDFVKKVEDHPFYVNAWLYDTHATLNPSMKQLEKVKQFKPGSTKFRGVEEIYFATLVEMDRQIGLFVEELDKRGLSENTLLIFSSDNGPEDYQIRNAAHSGVGLTGPFRGRKRSIYEGGIRVPFILRWPGMVPEDKVNNTSIVSAVDFIPTLCSITGVKLPDSLNLDGEDMSDAWLGGNQQRERPLYWEWRYRVLGHILNRPPMLAMREGDYKLLMNPDRSRIELYDVRRDPSEINNLATTHEAVVQNLSQKLLAWNATLPSSPADRTAGQNDWNWPN